MNRKLFHLQYLLLLVLAASVCEAQVQSDSLKPIHHYKNVIRYNLSGALIFGFDRYIVGVGRGLAGRDKLHGHWLSPSGGVAVLDHASPDWKRGRASGRGFDKQNRKQHTQMRLLRLRQFYTDSRLMTQGAF